MEDRKGGPIVVALGPGATGTALVRTAQAMARDAGTGFECLTVDTSEDDLADEGLAEARRLARDSGGSLASEPGVDAAASIVKYAAGRGASALVVGMGRRRGLRPGMAERLRAAAPSFPIVAVAEPRGSARPPKRPDRAWIGGPGEYLAAIAIMAAVTGLNLLLVTYADYWAAAIPYLAAISLMALALERGPVLFAALLSAAAWDLLFIPPRFFLRITRAEDAFMLALYFLVAVSSGWMTGMLRASGRLLAAREARLSRLSALAQALAGARTIGAILARSVEDIKEAFDAEAIVILREDGEDRLRARAESGWEPLDSNARSAAATCFDKGLATGRFTGVDPASEWHFVPMDGPRSRLGVIGLRAAHDRRWDEASESFLLALASTVSIAAARELG